MKLKHFLTTLLTMLASINAFSQSVGTTFTSGQLKYKITSVSSEKTVSVTGTNGTISGHLEIPRTVNYNSVSYKVTGFESNAFTTSNIGGVKSLYIDMQDIPANTLKSFSFMTLTIGPNVKTIASGCFGPIYKTIWLPNVVPSNYPGEAKGSINYCSSTNYTSSSYFSSSASSFTIYPNLSSRFTVNGVTYVLVDNNTGCDVIDCDYAASNISVNIGSTVTYSNRTLNVRNINDYACYRDDRITGDIILSNNGYVGKEAFSQCSNATGNITVSSQGDIKTSAFYSCSNISGTLSVSNAGSIGVSAFYDCSKAIAANIQNQGNIERQAFLSCTSLKTLTISNNGYIGWNAFGKCTGLQTLEITNNVLEIRRDAFKESKITETATINNNGHIRQQAFASVTGSFAAAINNNGILADSAFYQSQMKSLTIETKVTNVGPYCFKNSTISQSALIKNSGELGIYAFSNISGGFSADIRVNGALPNSCFYSSTMGNVTLGNGITSVGEYCFSSSKMNSITIGSNVNSLKNYCFKGATGFTSMVIPDNVLTLGTYCFQNCTTMQNITLSRGLTELPEGTFSGCTNLLRLDILKEINNIGNYSFNDCTNLRKLIFEDKDNNYTYVMGYGGTSSSKTPLFKACSLDTVYVGGRLSYDKNTSPYSPFRENTSLRSIRFANDKETKIYAREFENCTNLQNVWMNNVIDDIGDYAFKGCTALRHFEVAPTVTQLGAYSFSGCSKLTDINLSNVVTIKNNSFENCTSLPQISIPQSTTSIQDKTFQGCTSLNRLFIEDRTESLSLGKNASSANYKGISGAGKPLFADCPLDTLYIGGPINYEKTLAAGYSPFFYNESLRSVYITNKEKNVYKYEFYNCLGLERIKLGNGVRKIEEYGFQGCTNLSYFEFASTLQSIGDEAFSDCSNITRIISHAPMPPTVGEQGLQDINKFNCNLFVPEGSLEDYQEAEQWRDFWKIYELVTLTGITLSQNNLLFNSTGENATLTVAFIPYGAFGVDVTWASSNPAVATVSNTGVVTAVANGTAVITATTADGTNLTATCNVTVNIIPPIDFADANVKAICVANWDTNHNGELSKAEAASVTDLGEVFSGNTTITSFNELQYFTGLTSIHDNAFKGCTNLTSIILPNGLTTIGGCAFRSTAITSLTIPASVTYIAVSADGGGLTEDCTSLMNIYVEEDNSHYYSENGVLFSEDEDIIGANGKAILLFPQGRSGSYNIPSGVTVIAQRAFVSCKGLNSIVIPEGVTTIAGEYAFHGCSNLSRITIPSSMTNIGDGSFYNCSSISDVWCHAEAVPSTSSWAFYGSPIASATLHVPAASLEAYSTTAPWSGFGTIVPIGEGENFIDDLNELSNNKQYLIHTRNKIRGTLGVIENHLASNNPTATGPWVCRPVVLDKDNPLITSVSQLSSPYTEPTEGSLAAMIDGNSGTFWHSIWSGDDGVEAGSHYFQVEMVDQADIDVAFQVTRRQTDNDHITEWGVYGTNDANATKANCTKLAVIKTPYKYWGETRVSDIFSTGGYRYLRFYINKTTRYDFGHLAEFQLYPATLDETRDASPFAIIQNNDGYYLYSVRDKAFITPFNNGDENTYPLQLGDNKMHIYKHDGYFVFDFVETGYTINVNDEGVVVNTYGTIDDKFDEGNLFTIVEVGDFDPTEALAMFNCPVENETIEIATAEELANFATRVNAGETNLCATLKADIDFTAYPNLMIGSNHAYRGEFDGAGHTITLGLTRTNNHAGLFFHLSGNVHDLTTTGTITTSAMFAGGIASETLFATIERCQSRVNIVSSVNGDGTHGGIVGLSYDGTIIRDCLVSGSIIGSQTQKCGGVSGWASGKTTITNCLIRSTFSVSTEESDKLSRNSSNVTSSNNYFQGTWDAANNCTDVTLLTENQVESGEACYLLNNGRTDDDMVWYQTLGVDDCPVPDKRRLAVLFDNGTYVNEQVVNIAFADANVKALCVANWDTNHDGELSEAEAAAVTDLGEIFKGNTTITSFNELQYFTSLTTIGNNAFSGCSSLTSVAIPNSVNTISNLAFLGCNALNAVNIIDLAAWCNTSFGTLYSNPLYYAHHLYLNGEEIKDLVIPENVTNIGSHAFYYCYGLTFITIHNSVTNIGGHAFYGCNGLTSVTIPSSVTSIGNNVFGGCNLTSIVVASENNVYDSRDNCNAIVETRSNTLISGCKNTIIPNSITKIGTNAFYSCKGLTSINIPNSVTNIDSWAFSGSSLTSLTIPNSVTSIGTYAFYSCSKLTSVTIPNSITSIGNNAFQSCSKLTSVKVDIESPVSISSYTFSNRANATLYVPAGSKAAYEAADYWKEFKNIVEFIYGDVNSDEEVDVVDVVDIVRYVVDDPAETFVPILADINANGEVNVGDAVALVNEIAGEQNFVKPWRAPQQNSVAGDVLTLASTDNGMSLCMENERNYTAFQFDLYLPAGTDATGMLLNAQRKQGHQLIYNKVEEGHYRVAAISTSNSTFSGYDGELLAVSLEGIASEDICLRNIRFFTTDGEEHRFDDIVMQSGTATDIASPQQPSNEEAQDIYDLQGRKMVNGKWLNGKSSKGIYIVNGKKIAF